MLNSLVLRALSGFMAINMATAPISTQWNGDIVNPKFFGTYDTHLPNNKVIIVSEEGCKANLYLRGASSAKWNYVTTKYTTVCTFTDSKFTATYEPSQYVWVDGRTGETRTPADDDKFILMGNVEVRDDSYAPKRRYINTTNGFSYWLDL